MTVKLISFEKYSEEHIHFIEAGHSLMLEKAIENFKEKPRILDLGCGEGQLLCSLADSNLINPDLAVGVDLSSARIEKFNQNLPRATGIVSDASDIPELDEESFDLVVCTQVIEHVPDESKLLSEVNRLLRYDGLLYISSVVKRPWGVWLYRRDGEFRLDPTHIREYESEKEFKITLKNSGFEVTKRGIEQIKYPVSELFGRALLKAGLISPGFARKLGGGLLKLPIPGYKRVEVVCTKAQR